MQTMVCIITKQARIGDITLSDPRPKYTKKLFQIPDVWGDPRLGADSRAAGNTSVPGLFLTPIHCLNSMVPFKLDVPEHFHWCSVRAMVLTRSLPAGPAAHMLCRSTRPAEAETLAHNVAGSEVPLNESRGAFCRKSLASKWVHVIQASCRKCVLFMFMFVPIRAGGVCMIPLSSGSPDLVGNMFHNTDFKI